MTASGTCSTTSQQCKQNHYCPATDAKQVQCLPCSDDIQQGQGCFCQDYQVTENCLECANGKCSKFLMQKTKQDNSCALNCAECPPGKGCTKCNDGYTLDTQAYSCRPSCTDNSQCSPKYKKYCNINKQICNDCTGRCSHCSSETFCLGCNGQDYVLTIDGQCIDKCRSLQTGQYCNNGTPATCTEDSTSECTCGSAENCATCSEDRNSCQTCLLGMEKDESGACTKCIEGYTMLNGKCWLNDKIPTRPVEPVEPVEPVVPVDPSNPTSNKSNLSGGAISGIIIGALAVVGAISGTVIVIMRKSRKNQVSTDTGAVNILE
ncbi:Cysteine-rich membrane protein 1 [Spironucleus salmonicida]|uniref:Cysteine-rich membrane protein 1 n=1 Tax=Spironucleus salmonicida TaxID=348837 RepID=V6LGG6_9EUKA|nr:Cysteine-rich membrane protein 1 [Spironucleus salmonicida]|eukprot:EST42771.1 Cysteine-rich membrane protein 1 [Spironucleus salmonicida]